MNKDDHYAYDSSFLIEDMVVLRAVDEYTFCFNINKIRTRKVFY